MTFQAKAKEVINIEIDAIKNLVNQINNNFELACETIIKCTGRVIVLGVGKSGHVGHKIAATLASTGTPAFFIHPTEASHGDFGMITKDDVVLVISNSGTTPEIITLLPLIKRLGIKIISITGNNKSTIATTADLNLNVKVEKEACPHNLAPTASTTVTLVLGDALAIALLHAKGFTAKDFALSHPGGNLGKRLLTKVSDLMHTGNSIPIVTPDTPLKKAIIEMTTKSFGMTTITDEKNRLLGILTDGDLRRVFEKEIDMNNTYVKDIMTKNPKTALKSDLAENALNIMESFKITSLVVLDKEKHIEGIIHLHDILHSKIV